LDNVSFAVVEMGAVRRSKFNAQSEPGASPYSLAFWRCGARGEPHSGEGQITIGLFADRLDGAVAAADVANGLVVISVS
jgi:hypothetical protein